MATTTNKGRVYVVTIGKDDRLVRASSQAGALSHVARSVCEIRVASQDDLIDLLPEHDVEVASRDGAIDDPDMVVSGLHT